MHRFTTAATLIALITTYSITQAEQATIAVAEASVQSGPGSAFYATGKLRRGDTIEVLGEEGEYLAITPPRDAYSLIPKDAVQATTGKKGIVTKDGVETLIGSRLNPKSGARAATLNKGTIVTLLGETTLPADEGGTACYYIQPTAGEQRYIPASAIRQARTIVQTGGQMPPESPPLTGGSSLEQAEAAWQSRDWTKAKELYEELARGTDHEARMIACNRLEFIRKMQPGLRSRSIGDQYSAPSSYAQQALPQRLPVQSNIQQTYPYANNQGRLRVLPSNPAPAAPASRVPAVPAVQTRVMQNNGPSFNGANAGFLRRGFRKLADGRPLYLLENSNGVLRCYVAPSGNLNLEPFVMRTVELQGAPVVYHSALRGYLLEATQVTPLSGQ